MSVDEVLDVVRQMPGVVVVTAGAENGAPEVARGASSCSQTRTTMRETVECRSRKVVSDDAGFDIASAPHRPGMLRVNISVGRPRTRT